MHEYKDGSHGVYFESTPLKILTAVMVGCSLVGILTTNMAYLQGWIDTNRRPAQVLFCSQSDTITPWHCIRGRTMALPESMLVSGNQGKSPRQLLSLVFAEIH